MRDEAAGVAGNRGVRFANADSRRCVALLMADYPAADHRVHAIKLPEGREFLPDEALLAVIAPGFDVTAGLVERDVRALAAEQWLFDPRHHQAGSIETGLEQVRMARVQLPQHRQNAFIR